MSKHDEKKTEYRENDTRRPFGFRRLSVCLCALALMSFSILIALDGTADSDRLPDPRGDLSVTGYSAGGKLPKEDYIPIIVKKPTEEKEKEKEKEQKKQEETKKEAETKKEETKKEETKEETKKDSSDDAEKAEETVPETAEEENKAEEKKEDAGEETEAEEEEAEEEEEEEIFYFGVESKIGNSILYGATADTKNGYRGTVVPNAGYKLPESITATMSGDAFTGFSYNSLTGEIAAPPSAIRGTISFAGACGVSILPDRYKITASIGHGKATVTEDSTAMALEMMIAPDEDHLRPKSLILISGNKRFNDYTYDAVTGRLTIGSGRISRIMIFGVCPAQAENTKVLDTRRSMPKA